MKLFQLMFTLLVTAVIANAQLILGALAAIEIVVEIIEAAETVATLALDAQVAITGALGTGEFAGEVVFAVDITESGATLEGAAEVEALDAEVSLPNFTNAALNDVSAVGSTAEWTQAFTLNEQKISMDVVGSMQATVNVGADGTFTLTEGGLSGLFADFSLDTLSGTIKSSSVNFLTG